MPKYIGFDVSKGETAFCVKNGAGETVVAGKVATDPAALCGAVRAHCGSAKRAPMETGSYSGWLAREMAGLGVPVEAVDARQVHAAVAQAERFHEGVRGLGAAAGGHPAPHAGDRRGLPLSAGCAQGLLTAVQMTTAAMPAKRGLRAPNAPLDGNGTTNTRQHCSASAESPVPAGTVAEAIPWLGMQVGPRPRPQGHGRSGSATRTLGRQCQRTPS